VGECDAELLGELVDPEQSRSAVEIVRDALEVYVAS